jgi:hypothetical protein
MFAKEAPHLLRSIMLLPAVAILSAQGLVNLTQRISFRFAMIPTILLFFTIYSVNYYFIYPQRDSSSWAFGYEDLFKKIAPIEKDYDKIIVTGYHWKPYIFYLFYNKVDPKSYQLNGSQEAYGKYQFSAAAWDQGKDLSDSDLENLNKGKTLVVLSPNELNGLQNKKKFHQIDVVNDYANRKEVFILGELSD